MVQAGSRFGFPSAFFRIADSLQPENAFRI